MTLALLKINIKTADDAALVTQQAQQIAAQLGYDLGDRACIATAVTLLAENVRQQASESSMEFFVSSREEQMALHIVVTGKGIKNLSLQSDLQSLMDGCDIENGKISLIKFLPPAIANPDELNSQASEIAALQAQVAEQAAYINRTIHLKKEIISHLTHDFRTPLNSIISISQMIIDRLDGELTEEQEKQVSFIRKAAQNLTTLVNNLLDLAKIDLEKKSAPELSPEENIISTVTAKMFGEQKILIIDDSEADRYVFKRIIARPGLTVLEADSGWGGIELARQKQPNFIFLDLSLPDLTGFEILKNLTDEKETRHIPVIIHSSLVMHAEERAFIETRAKCIVSKDPAHAEEFKALVDSLLKSKSDPKMAIAG